MIETPERFVNGVIKKKRDGAITMIELFYKGGILKIRVLMQYFQDFLWLECCVVFELLLNFMNYRFFNRRSINRVMVH